MPKTAGDNATVIEVTHNSVAADGSSDLRNSKENHEISHLSVRPSVARTHSDRSTSKGEQDGNPRVRKAGKKLGHRRVLIDGEVTYKKFETTQLMGSIQLGLAQSVGSLAHDEDRDLLMKDFLTQVSVPFTRDGTLQKTPAHNYSEFRYK